MKKAKTKLQEMRNRYVKRIAVVSDMHVMSDYAVFPDKFVKDSGVSIGPSDGQKILLGYYKDFCRKVDEWECDTVLLAGDLIHGQNPKDRGTGLGSTDLKDQLTALGLLLAPLLKGRTSHWVSGSGYHNSVQGMKVEAQLCSGLNDLEKEIKHHWHGPIANLLVEPYGVINLTHGGSGAFIYRETAMAREIMFGKVAYASEKLPKIRGYIHGHWHWYCYLSQPDVDFIQMPCFVAYEPITIFTKYYTRFQPDIGAVILLIDGDGKMRVERFLYPAPHIADKVVNL
jgi:hypothetical protein